MRYISFLAFLCACGNITVKSNKPETTTPEEGFYSTIVIEDSPDQVGGEITRKSLGCKAYQAGLPDQLGCTGLYSDWVQDKIAYEAQPYSCGSPVRDDGTTAKYWVYFPPGTSVDQSDPSRWVFPIGTKFWQELSLNGRPMETRHSEKFTDQQWYRASYVWNQYGTEAYLAPKGKEIGTSYVVPAITQCSNCHGNQVDFALGFRPPWVQ